MSEFVKWWNEMGSGMRPYDGEDMEEHSMRVASFAWDAALKKFSEEAQKILKEE